MAILHCSALSRARVPRPQLRIWSRQGSRFLAMVSRQGGNAVRSDEDSRSSQLCSDILENNGAILNAVNSSAAERDKEEDQQNGLSGLCSDVGLKCNVSPDVEQRLRSILNNAGVTSFVFKRVPSDYYQRTFEERRDVLGAASIDHLCKSMVMVNTQAPEHITDCSDRNNSKYYVIVVQYSARLNAEKVKKFVYNLNNGKIPKKRFNLRLAPEEESKRLTGFEHNAITPIGMQTDIPVIMSDAITRLTPEFFWLGGGGVDLKLGIDTQEFIGFVKPFIIDCTYSDN